MNLKYNWLILLLIIFSCHTAAMLSLELCVGGVDVHLSPFLIVINRGIENQNTVPWWKHCYFKQVVYKNVHKYSNPSHQNQNN